MNLRQKLISQYLPIFSSLSVVNDSGYKLFAIQSVNKVDEIFSSDHADTRIAERLFSSSLVATVERAEQNKLKVSKEQRKLVDSRTFKYLTLCSGKLHVINIYRPPQSDKTFHANCKYFRQAKDDLKLFVNIKRACLHFMMKSLAKQTLPQSSQLTSTFFITRLTC